MDLGAQDGFLERAQSGRCQVLHPRDESLHRLPLRRPGGRIERCVGAEIGGGHLPHGLLPGAQQRLPNCRPMSSWIASTSLRYPVGSNTRPFPSAGGALREQPAHNRRPMQIPPQPAAPARSQPAGSTPANPDPHVASALVAPKPWPSMKALNRRLRSRRADLYPVGMSLAGIAPRFTPTTGRERAHLALSAPHRKPTGSISV